MTLPLVDPFYLPYEAWQTRHATLEEMLAAGKPIIYVNETLKARVSTAHEAAIYMADEGADNGLGNFIKMLWTTARSTNPGGKRCHRRRQPNFHAIRRATRSVISTKFPKRSMRWGRAQ